MAHIHLDDGQIVSTGLNLPNEEEQLLMSEVPMFPAEFMLDDSDLQKAFRNDFYKESRKRFAPYMINQNGIGSCNACAGAGAMHITRDAQGMKHVNLSPSQLYMRINGGSDRGSALINGFKELQSDGISPRKIQVEGREYTIPNNAYRRSQVSDKVLEQAAIEAKQFMGWEFFRAPTSYSEFARAVASALARMQPVVFAWHVGRSSSRLSSKGYTQVGGGKGNHATLAHSAKWVGGNDLVHPDMMNSWGPVASSDYGPKGSGWGDGGFGLFTMEDFYACNRWHYTYIVTSARPAGELV